jgi:hypothetical protein
MKEQMFQMHLARAVDLPEVRNEKGDVVRVPVNLPLPGMSGRVVRFRAPLPEGLHSKCELEAAKLAGKDSSMAELRAHTVRLCLCEMVRYVTEPVDSVNDVKPDDWTQVIANDFITGKRQWSELFTVQDTQVLEMEYNKWHNLPLAAVEVLSGKAIPVALEG